MSLVQHPVASVMIFTYNQQSTIGRTIDSILAQRVDFPYEIIIGEDDSPNDNTRQICEAYAAKHPDKIYLMPKQANKGLMRNFSDCLKQCRGRYIAACAGDDWWSDEDKLQMQVDFLDANPSYVMVYGGSITDSAVLNQKKYTPPTPPSDDLFGQLLHSNFIVAPTACYRAEVAQSINFEEFIERGFLMEDLPMWLTMAKIGRFHCIERPLVTYTLSPGSASNSSQIERQAQFENNVLTILQYFTQADERIDQHELLCRHYRSMVGIGIKYGKWGFTMRHIWRIGRWKAKDWLRFAVLITPFGIGYLKKLAQR